MLAGFLGLVGACGGGSGGGVGGAPHDFSGLWILYVTDDETGCDGMVVVNPPYLATVDQSGDQLTVTTPDGVFTGTVEGDQAVVHGTYPDGVGYTTFKSWVLNAQPSGFDGDVTWTFSLSATGLPVSCQGTSTVFGELAPPPITVAVTPLPASQTGDPVSHAMAIAGACGGTYWAELQSGALPNGVTFEVSNQSSPAGDVPVLLIGGTPRASGIFDFSILVSDPSCLFANNIVVAFSWAIAQGPLKILDCDPPLIPVAAYVHPLKYLDVDAFADTIFNQYRVFNLGLVGGTPPYACSIVDDPADPDDGSLPLGMSFPGGSASLLGAPGSVGPNGRPFRITIRATDDVGATAERKLQLSVLTPAPAIVTSSLPNAIKDVFYAQTVSITDGVPPFTFSVSAGNLPNGLTIDAGTGSISGTPTATGTSNFTVKVVNQLVAGEATKDLSITVN